MYTTKLSLGVVDTTLLANRAPTRRAHQPPLPPRCGSQVRRGSPRIPQRQGPREVGGPSQNDSFWGPPVVKTFGMDRGGLGLTSCKTRFAKEEKHKAGAVPMVAPKGAVAAGGSRFCRCPICGVHVALLLVQQHAAAHFQDSDTPQGSGRREEHAAGIAVSAEVSAHARPVVDPQTSPRQDAGVTLREAGQECLPESNSNTKGFAAEHYRAPSGRSESINLLHAYMESC